MKIKYYVFLLFISLGITFYILSFNEVLHKNIIVKNKYTEWTGKTSNVCKYYISDFKKEIVVNRVIYNSINYGDIFYYNENYNKYEIILILLTYIDVALFFSILMNIEFFVEKNKYKEIGGIPYNKHLK